jgi:SAM-dependent methyltransferase
MAYIGIRTAPFKGEPSHPRMIPKTSDEALVSKKTNNRGSGMDHDGRGDDGAVHGPASRIPQMADPALADRHAWLVDLIAPAAGERLADLGCGESPGLGLVVTRLDGGVAVGIDNSAEALREVRTSVPASGSRTVFIESDLADPLPLADGSMDAVFSYDVLELLPDPDAVLREVYRVLRPGGRLVLGHADFDTAVMAGADVELTRRLVHAYCDTQQSWMPRADGTIGRRLPEIVLRSPLALDHVTARVLLTRSLQEGGFGRFAVDHFVQALDEAGAASALELTSWRADLEAAAGRGAFLLSLNDYVVLASRR